MGKVLRKKSAPANSRGGSESRALAPRTEDKKERILSFSPRAGRLLPYTYAYASRMLIRAFHRIALATKSRFRGACLAALRNRVLDAFGRNSAEGRSRAVRPASRPAWRSAFTRNFPISYRQPGSQFLNKIICKELLVARTVIHFFLFTPTSGNKSDYPFCRMQITKD